MDSELIVTISRGMRTAYAYDVCDIWVNWVAMERWKRTCRVEDLSIHSAIRWPLERALYERLVNK